MIIAVGSRFASITSFKLIALWKQRLFIPLDISCEYNNLQINYYA